MKPPFANETLWYSQPRVSFVARNRRISFATLRGFVRNRKVSFLGCDHRGFGSQPATNETLDTLSCERYPGFANETTEPSVANETLAVANETLWYSVWSAAEGFVVSFATSHERNPRYHQLRTKPWWLRTKPSGCEYQRVSFATGGFRDFVRKPRVSFATEGIEGFVRGWLRTKPSGCERIPQLQPEGFVRNRRVLVRNQRVSWFGSQPATNETLDTLSCERNHGTLGCERNPRRRLRTNPSVATRGFVRNRRVLVRNQPRTKIERYPGVANETTEPSGCERNPPVANTRGFGSQPPGFRSNPGYRSQLRVSRVSFATSHERNPRYPPVANDTLGLRTKPRNPRLRTKLRGCERNPRRRLRTNPSVATRGFCSHRRRLRTNPSLQPGFRSQPATNETLDTLIPWVCEQNHGTLGCERNPPVWFATGGFRGLVRNQPRTKPSIPSVANDTLGLRTKRSGCEYQRVSFATFRGFVRNRRVSFATSHERNPRYHQLRTKPWRLRTKPSGCEYQRVSFATGGFRGFVRVSRVSFVAGCERNPRL